MVYIRSFALIFMFVGSATFSYSESMNSFGINLKYDLPSEDFVVTSQNTSNRRLDFVKFPSLHSDKYNLDVTADIGIMTDALPENVGLLDFISEKLRHLASIPGVSKNPVVFDRLECGIPNTISIAFEYTDQRNVIHDFYAVFFVRNHTGLMISFDCTDDLYQRNRGFFMGILKSMSISA